ncbi:MAG: hypothetical protein DDT33_01539 [Firmicutes bacterium]|nr:hypothetical protein [Bacillota bacterium]
MVKENPVAGKESITVSIIHRHPIGIDFGCSIGTSGMKRRILVLRWWRTAKHLATGCLIKFGFHFTPSQSFQNSGGTQSGDIPCILWRIKADPHMALGS